MMSSFKMATRKNRFRKGDRDGAAAVEFALIVPVFLLLVAGIVEFGQAFRTQHVLTTASRRAARALSMESADSSKVQYEIEDYCEKALGDVPVNVSIEVNGDGWGLESAEEGDAITVTVSVPYAEAGIAFFSKLISTSELSSSCTLERE